MTTSSSIRGKCEARCGLRDTDNQLSGGMQRLEATLEVYAISAVVVRIPRSVFRFLPSRDERFGRPRLGPVSVGAVHQLCQCRVVLAGGIPVFCQLG